MTDKYRLELQGFLTNQKINAACVKGNMQIVQDFTIDKNSLSSLKPAREKQITFAEDSLLVSAIEQTNAAVVFVTAEKYNELLEKSSQISNKVCFITVKDPRLTFARLMQHFPNNIKQPSFPSRINAVISENAQIHEDVYIGPGCVIEQGAVLLKGIILQSNVMIGKNCQIGSNTVIQANTVIVEDTIIGNDCIISANCQIGSQGFGYTLDAQADAIVTIEHYGKAVLGNRVHIGGGTQINRGTFQDTLIGDDSKIHDLCQISHNVVLGEKCAIAAGTVIAGSTVLGKGVHCVGHCLVCSSVNVADYVTLGVGSTVVTSLRKPNTRYEGLFPAQEAAKWSDRWWKLPKKLSQITQRLRKLEENT